MRTLVGTAQRKWVGGGEFLEGEMGNPKAKFTYFKFHQEPARLPNLRDKVAPAPKLQKELG